MTKKFDIAIVGGGIAGLTAALALAQKTTLNIAVLEAKSEDDNWTLEGYHHRVSAITLASVDFFQQLNIWDAIKAKRISGFSRIQVWDDAGSGEIEFDSRDIAKPLLGYIIENNLIQHTLKEALTGYPHVEIISPVKLETFNGDAKEITLTSITGEIYTATLAIGADGAQSWLREKAGISLLSEDYGHHAIVTSVKTENPHEAKARQVFLSDGPLAFLPLAESTLSSIVWSLPPEKAKEMMALSDEEFKQALTQAFSVRLGKVLEISKRFCFPLRKQRAMQYVLPNIALIGDAAHTVHPLAGQGINMGLQDVASLVEVIVDAKKNRRSFSSHATLRRYERWRKADNQAMLTGVDVLKQLFLSDKKSIQIVRSLGLNLTNQSRWLKNLFTRHAVGIRA